MHFGVESALIILCATTLPVYALKDVRTTGMVQNATVVLNYFISKIDI